MHTVIRDRGSIPRGVRRDGSGDVGGSWERRTEVVESGEGPATYYFPIRPIQNGGNPVEIRVRSPSTELESACQRGWRQGQCSDC